jgi:hypothetical protein
MGAGNLLAAFVSRRAAIIVTQELRRELLEGFVDLFGLYRGLVLFEGEVILLGFVRLYVFTGKVAGKAHARYLPWK